MCMIVDANKLGSLSSEKANGDAAPIRSWLGKRSGKLVYSSGGKFKGELNHPSKKMLVEYARAGYATLYLAERFAKDEAQLRGNSELKSDDPHILALARHSRARILYTADKDLMRDFKNKKLIDHPRGRIYSGSQNAGLLTRKACLSGVEAVRVIEEPKTAPVSGVIQTRNVAPSRTRATSSRGSL